MEEVTCGVHDNLDEYDVDKSYRTKSTAGSLGSTEAGVASLGTGPTSGEDAERDPGWNHNNCYDLGRGYKKKIKYMYKG